MNDKYSASIDEEPKHKKKSKKKGHPRADHRHQYEVVLLSQFFEINVGTIEIRKCQSVRKVCIICGRIGDYIEDKSYYKPTAGLASCLYWLGEPSEKALALPKWHADLFDKFAKPIREEN